MNIVSKSLKQGNVAWITSMIVLDLVILLMTLLPHLIETASVSAMMIARISIVGFIPPVILLLSALLTSDAKASLVFWRLKHALPGHRAFSVHAPADPRIDLDRLKKVTGAFPETPAAQNKTWYGLYKQVANEPAVADSHKHFLLFKDMAGVSALLIVVASAILLMAGFHLKAAGSAAAVFLAQYVLAALGARQYGVRFVKTVLAVHAATIPVKARAPRKTATKKAEETKN